MSSRVRASIELGCRSIRLWITESCPNGDDILLEKVVKSLHVRDAFPQNEVPREMTREIIQGILGFQQLCLEYGAQIQWVSATSSLRRRGNQKEIFEAICDKTGLSLNGPLYARKQPFKGYQTAGSSNSRERRAVFAKRSAISKRKQDLRK